METDQPPKFADQAPGLAPGALREADLVVVGTSSQLQTFPVGKRRRWLKSMIGLAVIAFGLGAGSYYWWKQTQDRLPVGIVSSNGRIEADQIDISAKFAGRVAELKVNEGESLAVQATPGIRRLSELLGRAPLKPSMHSAPHGKMSNFIN